MINNNNVNLKTFYNNNLNKNLLRGLNSNIFIKIFLTIF